MRGTAGWSMIVVVALMAQGCEVACTDEGIFAISVRVRDSSTDGPITSTPIGIVAYGENRDTLVYSSSSHKLLGGPIQAGTYAVEVRAEGYEVWRRENVTVVEAGRCSKVQPVELTADMVRLAAGG